MKKKLFITGGIFLVVLVLAGAAYVGGRLLTGQGLPGLSSGPLVINNGGGTQIRIHPGDIQTAKELPQTHADIEGIFDHRQDNSLFIGTGNVTMSVMKDRSGKVQTSSSHTGPVVEVVVTTKTVLYKDVTDQQFSGKPPVTGQKIQQVVVPGSLDEIGQSSGITVWGRQTGERYIADVLVYTAPAFITK